MAESLINIGTLAPHDEEGKVVDVDSGDGDDYSSGSDRSFEADDVDSSGRCESGSNGTDGNSELVVRSRRKRRHGSHGSRRHKGGSRHKHKGFHPYALNDEVNLKRKSQELQEKENAAAVVRREGAGQQFMTFPVAPFNSTQYLMDEHSANSPAGLSKTPSSSKLYSSSPQTVYLHSVPSTPAESNHESNIGYEKKDKEFVDIYTTVHAESLQSLPKEELVKHYMNLEEKVAALQKKVAEAEQQKQDDDSTTKSSREGDKECGCGSVCNSDTCSLSSNNEEFVDLSAVNNPCVSVGESCATNVESNMKNFSSSEVSIINSAEGAS